VPLKIIINNHNFVSSSPIINVSLQFEIMSGSKLTRKFNKKLNLTEGMEDKERAYLSY
jgi:hypothetical protein